MENHKTKIFFVSFFVIFLSVLIFLSVFLGPIILGFLIAYILNPFFFFLEKRGIPRKITSYVSIFFIILLTLLSIWFFFPILLEQTNSIIKRVPEFGQFVDKTLVPKVKDLIYRYTHYKITKKIYFYDLISIEFENISNSFLPSLKESGKFIFSTFLFIFAAPVFSYMFMRDLQKLYLFVLNLVPYDVRDIFLEFVGEVDKRLKAVIRGQIFIVLILCVLYPIAFSIANLPTAFAVGIIVGLSRFVPYMDVIVGVFLSFFILIVNSASGSTVIAVYSAFLIVQFLDVFFITPRIIGQFSGLQPYVVVIAVICFGSWFGFYGVLLAIPLSTITKVAIKYTINSYRKTNFFKKTEQTL